MCALEAPQHTKSGSRKRHVAVLASLAMAHMHSPVGSINITDLHAGASPQEQAHAVGSKGINPITQTVETVYQDLRFFPRYVKTYE